MKILLSGFFFLLVFCQHSFAQQQPETDSVEQQKMAMSKLSYWVGEWKGTGWSTNRQMERENFEILESITLKLQGLAFLIEGNGWNSDNNESAHEALAILSFDPSTEKYLMRSCDLRGTFRETEVEVHEDTFKWGFHVEESGLLIRFTIEIDQENWFEYGEVSPDDGLNWYRILEMNLTKQ